MPCPRGHPIRPREETDLTALYDWFDPFAVYADFKLPDLGLVEPCQALDLELNTGIGNLMFSSRCNAIQEPASLTDYRRDRTHGDAYPMRGPSAPLHTDNRRTIATSFCVQAKLTRRRV